MDATAAIAVSGMNAASLRLTASASNVANMDDVAAAGGTSGYQPVGVATSTGPGGGVVARAVTLKPASFLSSDSISPVGGVQGLASMPEIDPIGEISNQIQAGHAYAFSAMMLQADDENQQSLFDITS